MKKASRLVCLLAVISVFGSVSYGATIGFEAESGTIAGYSIANDAGASDGKCIVGVNRSTSAPGTDTASYTVNFAQTGSWYLYAHVFAPAPGWDSFFAPSDFATLATPASRVNGTGDVSPGTWLWIGVTQDITSVLVPEAQFSQSEPLEYYNVTATGEATFAIAGREENLRIDKFVFSTELDLTPAELTAAPEPATMTLLSIGALAMLRRRRRR
jgi:hypothetical protein